MNTDDPKFTAHILGELDELTAAERAEIEALIRADATAAAERAETQALAALLRRELQGEAAEPLTPAQRATVLAATAPGGREKTAKVIAFPTRLTWLSAIAACLIVGVSMALIFRAFEPGKSASGTAKVGETNGGPKITLPREPEPGASLALMVPDVALAATADGSSPEGLTTESQALIAQQMHASPPPMSAPKVATPAQSPRLAKMAKAPAPAPGTSQPIADETHVPAVQGAPTKLAGNAAEPQMPASTKTDSAASGAAAPNGGNQLFALEIPAAKTAAVRSPLTDSLSLHAVPPPPRPPSVMAAEAPREAGQGFAMGGHGGAGKSDKTKSAMTGASAHLQGAGLHDGESYRRLEKDAAEKPGAELRQREPANTEAFDAITDNAFLAVRENPLSTFSIDVDTASYAIVRRFLNERQLPPKGAVRIEELLNYFTYDYPQPQGDAPFSAAMEVATCPWTPAHRLVRIGLKGREIAKDNRPASNLVFLIDVSGSMQPANRLPLLKQSLGLLIDQLGEEDRVGIVVYAGSSGCVLQPTHDKAEMRLALDRLEAGGSTNGASGIELAYQLAKKSFIKGGTNRVILATDGDWNVGVTNQSDLTEMITKQAKSGVFLTVLGFGMGNLKDAMLVKLAGKGNGNSAYLDTLPEAKKVLVEQFSGTIVTIAKDVKIQVEFNPAQVSGYRLIGYEKRLLAKEDFHDDQKDAGEIGAGHTVTALYEVVPAGKDLPAPAKVDALKYQTPAADKSEISPELLTLKLRYKAPDGDASKLLEFPLTDAGATWEKSTRDFRFAAAVAGYGMLLRDSPHKGAATWSSVHELAVEGQGADATGYRAEFISLLEKAKSLHR